MSKFRNSFLTGNNEFDRLPLREPRKVKTVTKRMTVWDWIVSLFANV